MQREYNESIIRRAFRRMMGCQNSASHEDHISKEDMCDRFLEICSQEHNKDMSLLNIPRNNFADFQLDHYTDEYDDIGPRKSISAHDLARKAYETCFSYATTFSSKADPGNIFLTGGPGTGKTFFASCVAYYVADNGFFVVCENIGNIISTVNSAEYGDHQAKAMVRKYIECDLLVIEDLGAEISAPYVNPHLFRLLNDRLVAGKPMIISTSMSIRELRNRYSDKIISRLTGDFERVWLQGDDIREKNGALSDYIGNGYGSL